MPHIAGHGRGRISKPKSTSAPPGEKGGGGYVAPSKPKPFVPKPSAPPREKGGGGYVAPKNVTGTTIGPVGLGSPPPKTDTTDKKPIKTTTTTNKTDKKPIKKTTNLIFDDVPEDFRSNWKTRIVSAFDKSANFAMNSAALRFGVNNYGSFDWDKRNAQQHLIWSTMNPFGTTLHEFVDTATSQTFDNQDIHNNKLRNEVIARAKEIDSKKGLLSGKLNYGNPSESSIEQASFDMIKEQESRLEQGLPQSTMLPWIDTTKPMGNLSAETGVSYGSAQAGTLTKGVINQPHIEKKPTIEEINIAGRELAKILMDETGLISGDNIIREKLKQGKDAVIGKTSQITGIEPEIIEKTIIEGSKRIIKDEPLFKKQFKIFGGTGSVEIDPIGKGFFLNWSMPLGE